MISIVVVLGLFALWMYGLLDAAVTRRDVVRRLPKFAWIAVIVLFGAAGSLAWLMLGRPRPVSGIEESRRDHPSQGGRTGAGRARPWTEWPIWPPSAVRARYETSGKMQMRRRRVRPLAPDDDPEFLRELSDRIRRDGDNPRRPSN